MSSESIHFEQENICFNSQHSKIDVKENYILNINLNLVVAFRFILIFPDGLTYKNRISGAMVSVLASNVVDSGFKPFSGRTQYYKIAIYCFSAKQAALRRKEQRLVGSESEIM